MESMCSMKYNILLISLTESIAMSFLDEQTNFNARIIITHSYLIQRLGF